MDFSRSWRDRHAGVYELLPAIGFDDVPARQWHQADLHQPRVDRIEPRGLGIERDGFECRQGCCAGGQFRHVILPG